MLNKSERSGASEVLIHWTAKFCWGSQISFWISAVLFEKENEIRILSTSVKWKYYYSTNHALWELQLNNEIFGKMLDT